MDSDTGQRVVGVLFIVATVASVFGSVALGSTLDGPDYLPGVAGQESRVILAVPLLLIAASSAFATAFLLFPILRRRAEGLAAGSVGLRAFENAFYVAGTQNWPVDRQSGRSLNGASQSRRGNHRLKNAMFLAAFASLRSLDSKAFYDCRRAEGKRDNAAQVRGSSHRHPRSW